MRKTLMKSAHLDGHSSAVAKRVVTALNLTDSLETMTVSALSTIDELRLHVRDLQRENLELTFLVDNPGFDVGAQLNADRLDIQRFFVENSETEATLYQRYGYEFFEDNYHPEYVMSICHMLCTACADAKIVPHPLWELLQLTTGFITQEIITNFGTRDINSDLI